MNALLLGLIAAFCWGFHDICVRFISQKTPISACILTVLVTGLAFHSGLMLVQDSFVPVPMDAAIYAALAGVFFVIATFGLYLAFQRGPVRLVAPLIASYPILSVGAAAAQGNAISPGQWMAVVAIVIGVAVVAALSDDSTDDVPPKGPTVAYALLASVGFAGTFALGQHAAELSHEMPTTFITRVIAVAVTVAILIVWKLPFWPGKSVIPLLVAMGVADGIALLCVLSAGNYADPQYAAVTSSMFGLITILLAWVWLKEKMSLPQWSGCLIAFCGVGYLAI